VIAIIANKKKLLDERIMNMLMGFDEVIEH